MSGKPDVVVVDDDDRVIAYKKWADVLPTDRVRISSVWISNQKGEVLIAQRSHRKANMPLLWGPSAAGTVEPHETYEENIYKELAEEIGLEGIQLEEIGKVRWDASPTERRYCMCYRGVCDWPIEKFRLQEDEVDAIQWVSISELRDDIRNNPKKYLQNSEEWLKLFNLVD